MRARASLVCLGVGGERHASWFDSGAALRAPRVSKLVWLGFACKAVYFCA